MPLNLSITTPEGLVHEGEATMVVVPASDGELGILAGHAPLIAQLGAGSLRVHPGNGKEELAFFVDGGFAQVSGNQVLVLATRAESAGEIDRAGAEKDLEKLRAEPRQPGASVEELFRRSERIRAVTARIKAAR